MATAGAFAILGQQADPATKRVTPIGEPDGALTIGAVIALTGNANLYGQDQRQGLDLARRWADALPLAAGTWAWAWANITDWLVAPDSKAVTAASTATWPT